MFVERLQLLGAGVAQTDHYGQDEAAAEEGHRKTDGYFDGDGHGTDSTVCRTVETVLLQLTDLVPTH